MLEGIWSNVRHEFYNYPLNKFNLGDSTILDRGYPLMKPCSGTYVKEAQFGNMIRKAVALGFTLVGYEDFGKGRELNQAKNIANVFEIDPDAKIIVHCGYGHLIEKPRARNNGTFFTPMACHLKNITGFDPLTIDQTQYFNYANLNEKVFAEVEEHTPQVIIHKENAFKSHQIEDQENWDLTIFHKPITYVDNRPAWLLNNNNNQLFEVDQSDIKIDYPVRIKLLDIEDRLDAVPIDIMSVEDRTDSKLNLYGDLQNGKFIIENQQSDRQVIKTIGSTTTSIDKK